LKLEISIPFWFERFSRHEDALRCRPARSHEVTTYSRIVAALLVAMSILAAPSSGASAGAELLWHASVDLNGKVDRAAASATAPDGSTIVVVGASRSGGGGRPDYAIAAFATSDGGVEWSHGVGSVGRADVATAVSVSPDGGTTAVTGLSHRRNGARIWRTIAYSTGTGARLWQSTFRVPDAKMESPQGVWVGDDEVLVVGNVQRKSSGPAAIPAVVVADDRSDGSERWMKVFQPHRYPSATPGAIVHSSAYDPNHDALYLGLQVDETATQNSMGVLAISADDGAKLWRSWFVSPTGEMGAHPTAMDVSADASTVYIGGTFDCCSLRFVLAFATSDGSLVWSSEVTANGRHGGLDALSASLDGSRIYGAGHRYVNDPTTYRTLTFRLDAADGASVWKSRFRPEQPDLIGTSHLAVSPDGSAVYVTASTSPVFTDPEFSLGPPDILTLAYDAASGHLLWSAVRGRSDSAEFPVSVDYASGHVVVCGTTAHRETHADLTCLAYAP
jgi:hypothetical protein